MSENTVEHVIEVIDCEGFDYAFTDYSNFDAVQDEEFHILREAFLDARVALKEYLGKFGEVGD